MLWFFTVINLIYISTCGGSHILEIKGDVDLGSKWNYAYSIRPYMRDDRKHLELNKYHSFNNWDGILRELYGINETINSSNENTVPPETKKPETTKKIVTRTKTTTTKKPKTKTTVRHTKLQYYSRILTDQENYLRTESPTSTTTQSLGDKDTTANETTANETTTNATTTNETTDTPTTTQSLDDTVTTDTVISTTTQSLDDVETTVTDDIATTTQTSDDLSSSISQFSYREDGITTNESKYEDTTSTTTKKTKSKRPSSTTEVTTKRKHRKTTTTEPKHRYNVKKKIVRTTMLDAMLIERAHLDSVPESKESSEEAPKEFFNRNEKEDKPNNDNEQQLYVLTFREKEKQRASHNKSNDVDDNNDMSNSYSYESTSCESDHSSDTTTTMSPVKTSIKKHVAKTNDLASSADSENSSSEVVETPGYSSSIIYSSSSINKQSTKPNNVSLNDVIEGKGKPVLDLIKKTGFPYNVTQNSALKDLMVHVFKETQDVLDALKHRVHHTRKIDFITNEYISKYREYSRSMRNRKVKTKLGGQKVIFNTLDTSKHITNRLINLLLAQSEYKSALTRGHRNDEREILTAIEKLYQGLYKHVCEKYKICRSTYGYLNFIVDMLNQILRCSDDKMNLALFAFKYAFLRSDLSPIFNAERLEGTKRMLDDAINWESSRLRNTIIVLRNIVGARNRPMEVWPGMRKETIEYTVAITEIFNEFDEKISATNENKAAWNAMKDSLERYVNGEDTALISKIMINFMYQVKREGVEKFDRVSVEIIKGNLNYVLKHR